MSDPFIAEIRMFGFNFPPRGWATCDGQLMSISQNTALFSIIGTTFGGDGRSTFALPDLRDRMPMHAGQGRGLSPRYVGERGGAASVSLRDTEMPSHQHAWKPSTEPANLKIPSPSRSFAASNPDAYAPGAPAATMAPQTITVTGQGLPHTNIQPSLCLLFCIALEGFYPQRP